MNTQLSDPATNGNEGLSLASWVYPAACTNTWGHYILTAGGYVPSLTDPWNVYWSSYSLIYNHSDTPAEDQEYSLLEFESSLEEKRPPETNGPDNLRSLAMVFAAIQSKNEEAVIQIEDLVA